MEMGEISEREVWMQQVEEKKKRCDARNKRLWVV